MFNSSAIVALAGNVMRTRTVALNKQKVLDYEKSKF